MSRGVMPLSVHGRQNNGAMWYRMFDSKAAAGAGFGARFPASPERNRPPALDCAAVHRRYCCGKTTFATYPRPGERAKCSAWANALGSRATAFEPDAEYLVQSAMGVNCLSVEVAVVPVPAV